MNERSSSHLGVYATLMLVMLLWAGNSIVARAIHSQIGPFSLAFCRWTGAVIVLMPFALRHLLAERATMVRHWRPILLLGLVGVGAFNALLYSGLAYTTATNGLLIQAGIPAFVLLLDRLLFGVRPAGRAMLGVAISTVGVAVIVFRADPRALLSLSFGRGDALILCAVVAWSVYTALLRTRPAIHPLSFLTATFVIGALTMLPLAAYEWRSSPILPTREVLLGIGYVAVLPSVVAYLLFNRAVAVIGAAAAGQTISLQPLFGALLAALILGEPLSRYHLIGMAFIVAGIATAFWSRRPAAAARPPQ